MGISSFSDFPPGLLLMLIINTANLVAAIKQKLCSLFSSLGFIPASNYNMEAAEYSDQQTQDESDQHGYDRVNSSLNSRLTNMVFEVEILSTNPLLFSLLPK